MHTTEDKSVSVPNREAPVMATFELQISWWQPLSDLLRGNAESSLGAESQEIQCVTKKGYREVP